MDWYLFSVFARWCLSSKGVASCVLVRRFLLIVADVPVGMIVCASTWSTTHSAGALSYETGILAPVRFLIGERCVPH